MPTKRDKQRRARRLAKIRQAVKTVEDRLAIGPDGVLSSGYRSLYYLERLAKKAK